MARKLNSSTIDPSLIKEGVNRDGKKKCPDAESNHALMITSHTYYHYTTRAHLIGKIAIFFSCSVPIVQVLRSLNKLVCWVLVEVQSEERENC